MYKPQHGGERHTQHNACAVPPVPCSVLSCASALIESVSSAAQDGNSKTSSPEEQDKEQRGGALMTEA